MYFSREFRKTGGSGFLFDKNPAYPDAVKVSGTDVRKANNLPSGKLYDFDDSGALLITDAPLPSAAEILAFSKAAKIDELRAACSDAIYAGFTSSALGGVAHTYPALDRDQANLTASVLASTLPNLPAGWTTSFWCADAAGAWAFRPHTAAEIQQVGMDGKAAIEAALQKNANLAATVEAALTEAEVAAITW